MAYTFTMVWEFGRVCKVLLVVIIISTLWACATTVPALVDSTQIRDGLVVGRILTALTGDRSRRYLPQMRFLELEELDSHKRFQVEIESPDQPFAIDLRPGRYRLTRVQISEGPFMSMANLDMVFRVDASVITHVGTWRFGIDSPRYGRMLVASVIADQEEIARVHDFLDEQYPTFDRRVIVEMLPQPLRMEARLFEVMPYPRYPRIFRRHWW
jgi:hypothetical protein